MCIRDHFSSILGPHGTISQGPFKISGMGFPVRKWEQGTRNTCSVSGVLWEQGTGNREQVTRPPQGRRRLNFFWGGGILKGTGKGTGNREHAVFPLDGPIGLPAQSRDRVHPGPSFGCRVNPDASNKRLRDDGLYAHPDLSYIATAHRRPRPLKPDASRAMYARRVTSWVRLGSQR